MELLLEIIGYGFITVALGAVLFVFIKLFTVGLDALTNHDD